MFGSPPSQNMGAFYYSAIWMIINQPFYALNTSHTTIQTQSGNRKNIAFFANSLNKIYLQIILKIFSFYET